jgi:Right handed beta helix region
MSPRSLAVVAVLGAGLALAPAGEAKTVRVKSEAGFAKAVRQFRSNGGTIVLRPQLYRRLVIPPRRTTRTLRIVGTVGARVGDVVFDRTQHVSFGRVRIGPVRGDALVEVNGSRHILLHDLFVSAAGSRYSASILLPDSRHVTIRHSRFTHCGDHSWDFVNCITFYRWSHHTTIEDSRFADCRGCDFINGRFGTHLTIRRNTFDRALPCRKMGNYRCGHNDLVQLFAGRFLRVAGNRFGVYKAGGAQLYLTNNVDYATIVNNVFVGTDPKVPNYRARMGIVIGANRSTRLPHYVKVVNNTILTGARRKDGYEGSIRMSSRYSTVKRWMRPIIANNIIGLLEMPARVCNGAQRFVANLVIQGRGCSKKDWVGPANLDRRGRPRADSTVIDGGNRHYAPSIDATGHPRSGRPDIGALEYRART